MPNKTIYTIGHSTHELGDFINILTKYSINCIVDVRSAPFSSRVPHFNKDELRQQLENHGVVYLHLPKAFGARQKDPNLLNETGRVDFEKVRQTDSFKEGIDKLHRCIGQGFTVSLMCSEANPLDCHRFSMISYQLVKKDFSVKHILKDGNVVDNDELERRLLARYSQKIASEALFEHNNISNASLVELAYKLSNKEIGFLAKQGDSETKHINSKTEGAFHISFSSEGVLPFSNESDPGHLLAESSDNGSKRHPALRLYTIGFTNKPARKFFELLAAHNVKKIIDTRINNVSQLSGFAKGTDLEFFAKAVGNIDYSHELYFAPTNDLLKRYRKKQISWDEYAVEYSNLLAERRVEEKIDVETLNNACLLCSEHLPDKCHRRLLANYIIGIYPEIEVIHLK